MFYVSTTWKHENEINNEKMQNLLASFKGTNPNVKEVHWWKIDNFTHGALVIYNSEKGYVESKLGDAEGNRRGRRKRIFLITAEGKTALKEARDARMRVWDMIPDFVMKFA